MKNEQIGGKYHDSLLKCRTLMTSNLGLLLGPVCSLSFSCWRMSYFYQSQLIMVWHCAYPWNLFVELWQSKRSKELNQSTNSLSNFQSHTPSSCSFSNTVASPVASCDILVHWPNFHLSFANLFDCHLVLTEEMQQHYDYSFFISYFQRCSKFNGMQSH